MIAPIDEKDLMAALTKIRDLRLFAITSNLDPWALRQALIMALELSTIAAIDTGIQKEKLDEFDQKAREATKDFVKQLAKAFKQKIY